MPPEDEAAQQPTEETAEQDAASTEETPAQDTPDYEQRYNDLRPEFDRKSQTLSEYEQFIGHLRDPETQAEALQALGLQLEEDEEQDDEEWDDPEERLEAELEGVKEYLAEQQQAQQFAEYQEREVDYVDDAITELEDEESIELSDKELGAVVRLADTLRDEDGWPDVKAAWEMLGGVSETQRERYIKSKRSPQVQSGASPSKQENLDDKDSRREYLARRLAEETPAA
jgi:hypothetical protein